MTISIDEFAKSIDELFPNITEQTTEVILRAYINRSYYITFHYIKQYLETNFTMYRLTDDGTFKTGTHNRIYLVLEDLAKTNKNARKIAMQFKDFLAKRHKADYDLTADISYYDAMQCKKYLQTLPNLITTL